MERLPTDDESPEPAIDREGQRRALIDLYEAQDERARYFGDAEFLHEGLADEDVSEPAAISDPSNVRGPDTRPLEYLWLWVLDQQTLTVHLKDRAEGSEVVLHRHVAPEVDRANRIEGYAWDTFTGWSVVGTDYQHVDGELETRVQAALKERHPLPTEAQLRRAAQLKRVPAAAPGDPLWLLGFFDDSVVVIPAHEAFRLAKLNRALEHANTWGELLARIAADEIAIGELEAKFDELPPADTPFDPNDVPGFADGDWPAWPAQKMLEWLPESVLALGSISRTAINGDALHIPFERVDDVTAALTAEGIEVGVDAVGYIRAACGDWREVIKAREAAERAADAESAASSVPDGSFVVDEFDGSLVVMPVSEARRLADLNDALEESQTWGEFLARVQQDQDTQEFLAHQFDDDLPAPEQRFDASDLPGFDDGDWPAWPKQKMLDWLPASVRKMGSVFSTAINGDALHIDENLVDEVIEALASEGIECSEDAERAVPRACGAWRYGL